MIKTIDDISFCLREDFDFGWLSTYGNAFCVYDRQDSGNICFGLDNGHDRTFIKVAGATTTEYKGNVQMAVERLKSAMPVYRQIRHPGLIRLLDHFDIRSGYAAVFEWVDGECLHAHWDFERHPKYTHSESPNVKFRQLGIKDKLDCLDTIFDFHMEVARCGYIAIDFYDGSILYDFEKHRTTICDIDFYAPKPVVNTMGRMWGSSRFMSPEEFELGAQIDEVTNVFTMGAVAFELLGNNRERTMEHWTASEELYRVATKAADPCRNLRYTSMGEFYRYWKAAAEGAT